MLQVQPLKKKKMASVFWHLKLVDDIINLKGICNVVWQALRQDKHTPFGQYPRRVLNETESR